MFKVGIVTSKNRIEAKSFATREEVDDYILSFSGEEEVIHFRIEENGQIIETERGKR